MVLCQVQPSAGYVKIAEEDHTMDVFLYIIIGHALISIRRSLSAAEQLEIHRLYFVEVKQCSRKYKET